MLLKFSTPKLLQIIDNMNIGGAQRSASSLMRMPGVEVELSTYETLNKYTNKHYDAVMLHVWCAFRDKLIMNWPKALDLSYDQIVVFNHDWHGWLDYGADKYIVYSQYAYENTYADNQVYIVPGGIPTHHYIDIQPRSVNKPLIIGRLSTMLSGKISKDTIYFWKDIAVTQFLIGGDGPQRESLEAAFYEDSRFIFPGAISPRNVAQFLTQIDIFLYDTTWHTESFGYVILEAMAAGCIVVARDKGALKELIQHGYNGFLYTSDVEALSICQYLINQPNLRLVISRTAHEFAFSYSLERFYANVLAVFDWLI